MIRAMTKRTEIFCLVFQYIGVDPWTFCALLGNGRGAGKEKKITTTTSMVILTPTTMFGTMKKKIPKRMSLICSLISTRRTCRFDTPSSLAHGMDSFDVVDHTSNKRAKPFGG